MVGVRVTFDANHVGHDDNVGDLMLFEPSSSVQVQIIAGLKQITDAVERWAVPLAAIGSVSMAFIQAGKNVTPIRAWFQRVRLRKWLLASIRADRDVNESTRISHWLKTTFRNRSTEEEKKQQTMLRKVEEDLISLATSNDISALYNLPSDELCDQIRKVVSVILDYPEFHRDLLRCLARGASRSDVNTLMKEQESTGDDNQFPENQKEAFRKFSEAKGRILVQVRCSVDAIQTSIGFRWKFWLQLISMILSGILGVVALNLGAINSDKGAMDRPAIFWTSVLIGLLAGFLAPVARDLVAALEKLRS
jgi:hypothetical protein